MKRGGELLRQRIENEISLPLASIFLIDQRHNARHRGRGSRGAPDHGHPYFTRGRRAVSGVRADYVRGEVAAVGSKEGNVG